MQQLVRSVGGVGSGMGSTGSKHSSSTTRTRSVRGDRPIARTVRRDTLARRMPNLASVGLAVPEILLPAASVDLARWAVVACDQYTSEPEYWKAADERVGRAPSALRLVLPEAWLGAAEEPARIAAIQRA